MQEEQKEKSNLYFADQFSSDLIRIVEHPFIGYGVGLRNLVD